MPENKAIQTADAIMRTIIRDVAAQGAIKIAQAEVPFLALPIISGIFSFFVGRVADWIYKSLENFVAFKIIDNQVGSQVDEYKKAIESLHASIAINQGVQDASEKYKAALKNLIHYNGHD